MKKKKISNLIFTVLLVCILAAGILGAGFIRGWFEKPNEESALLYDVTGVCTLLRDGVSYPVSDTTVLRNGDKLTCQNGAVVSIQSGQDQLVLGENAIVTVLEPNTSKVSLQVESGAVFAHCESSVSLSFHSNTIQICNATALLSMENNHQTVSVFRGTVEQVQAGQRIQYTAEASTVEALTLDSLSDFTVTQIRQLKDSALCFTTEDLDLLATKRQQEVQELLNSQPQSTVPTETTTVTPTTQPTGSTEQATTQSTTVPVPQTTTPDTTAPETQNNTPTTPAPVGKCSVSIYCTTILSNMESLDPGKAEFVPSDGTILYPVTVDFYEGETVFDVLKRVCSTTGIQLEYSWTPLYNSYYIEGIHQLYEFDCGFESGWMYKVNGWFPNYGCSSYQVKDGDTIVWVYTCQGLGVDLGARMQ